ncbi:MAG: VanW family protein [Candidatus Absconditabacterales bacterium]
MNNLGKRILIVFSGFTVLFVSTLAVAFGFFQEGTGGNQEVLVQDLRIQAIQQLIEKKFDRFVTIPFGPGSDNMHLTGSTTYPDYPDYIVNTGIQINDDLDILLEKKIQKLNNDRPFYSSLTKFFTDNLTLNDDEIKQLQNVYLFKNEKDLKGLGYVVSSYRTRINNDADWRKNNISISYRNIGNVRVLNTNEEFSFMNEVHNDTAVKYRTRGFVAGFAIMGGITKVGGGGICGASRGINTMILPNRAFEIMTRYNHTRTYKNMYQNEINGKEYRIPGLDVAVYRMSGGTKDFIFKNIREYPVVLIMNYDGTRGGMEELFVLSHEEDRGTLEYMGHKGNCYTWEANGVPFKSCYNSVSGW